ncbi:MAG: hypothetical protein C4294_05785 [Nitrospiraceae bacterium]
MGLYRPALAPEIPPLGPGILLAPVVSLPEPAAGPISLECGGVAPIPGCVRLAPKSDGNEDDVGPVVGPTSVSEPAHAPMSAVPWSMLGVGPTFGEIMGFSGVKPVLGPPGKPSAGATLSGPIWSL